MNQKKNEILNHISILRDQLTEFKSREAVSSLSEIDSIKTELAQYGIALIDETIDLLNDYSMKEWERGDIGWDDVSDIDSDNKTGCAKKILNDLSGISQLDSNSLKKLLHLCLKVVGKKDIRSLYTDRQDSFPLKILLKLSAVDKNLVVNELCNTISNHAVKPQIIVVAIIALGRIGDYSACDALIGILKEHDIEWDDINPTAACALVDIGNTQAVSFVVKSIKEKLSSGNHSHWAARDYIASKLPQLLSKDDNLYQDTVEEWRESDWELFEPAILECGKYEAVEIATKYAAEEGMIRAISGTKILASIQLEEATISLAEILGTRRRYVVSWETHPDYLGVSPDKEDWNTEQRKIAAEALINRKWPHVKTALKKILKDEDTEIRSLAESFLNDG